MTATAELNAWFNGTPTGGPHSDGRYPLTYKDGNVYLVYCPAAQALNPALVDLPVELFAEAAADSASQASGSAITAESSRVAAQAAAADATAAKNLAQDWAVKAVDMPVTGGQFSAYHWAQKASEAAEGVSGDMPTERLKGRVTAGTGAVENLTAGQVRTLLNVADGATAGATWGASLAGIPANITSWAAIAPSAKQDALGYTPVNKAGDAMTGVLMVAHGTNNYLGSSRAGYAYSWANLGNGVHALWDAANSRNAWLYNGASGGSSNFAGTLHEGGYRVWSEARFNPSTKVDRNIENPGGNNDANTPVAGFAGFTLSDPAPNSPAGHWTSVIQSLNDNAQWGFQFAHPWFQDEVYFRSRNNGAWGAWRQMWHNGNSEYSSNGKTTFSTADSWLRLNQAGHYTSGVYTPGNLTTGGSISVGTVLHAGDGTAGVKVRIGDDAGLADVSLAHVLGVQSQSNAANGGIKFGDGPIISRADSATLNISGSVVANGAVRAYGQTYCHGWFRSQTSGEGWYHDVHGGGIYMGDNTWVRVYNNKGFWADNVIRGTDLHDAVGNLRYIPQIANAGNSNLAFVHSGCSHDKTGNGAYTITIQSNAAVVIDVGATVTFQNMGGTTGVLVIARGSGVAIYRNGANADIILQPGHSVTLRKMATDVWQA